MPSKNKPKSNAAKSKSRKAKGGGVTKSKPNSWVSQVATATTQLLYALQVDPAPLTVSLPENDPTLASLQFVITNPTGAAVPVKSISFTLEVGTGTPITPTTDKVQVALSDSADWTVSTPGKITSGTATYTLLPKSGASYSLPANASVALQIYQMQTVTTPGTSTIVVKEVIQGASPGFTSFLVTTFPAGFFFNSLAASVPSASNLVPVAQVNTGTPVTLTWNTSVVDTNAFTIYYTDASGQQQAPPPALVGEWVSPPITCDTVFTVVVTIEGPGGQKLPASLSIAVSVQNPSLVAASVQSGQLAVAGNATVGGTLGVTGPATLGNVSVGGMLGVNGNTTLATTTTGALTAASANVSGRVGIGTQQPAAMLHVHGNYQNDGTGGFMLDASDTSDVDYYLQLNPYAPTPNLVGYQFVTVSTWAVQKGPVLALAFDGTGNVGIGTTSPQAPLDVEAAPGPGVGGILAYFNSDGTGTQNPSGDGPYSIIASAQIKAGGGFRVSSDARIKTNPQRSNALDDLARLLDIQITDYQYKDTIAKGTATQKKVVAQQVEKVFPQAVSKTTDVVPDIFKKAECKDGWVELMTDLKVGDRVRLMDDKSREVYDVLEIDDKEHGKFRTAFKPEGNALFVYGREVKDFGVVDYDAIAMLNVSATQQIKREKDGEVKALRVEIAELRAANVALMKRLQKLERKMESVPNLAAAGAAGGAN
jgi:hypothetical protein